MTKRESRYAWSKLREKFYSNSVPQLTNIIQHSSKLANHQDCLHHSRKASSRIMSAVLSLSQGIAGKTIVKGSILIFLRLPVGFLNVLCQKHVGVE